MRQRSTSPSPDQLTEDDLDASVDLYMWSEEGEAEGSPLTLVSKGNNPGNPAEPGSSDACTGSFTTPQESMSKNCDVITFSDISYCQLSGGSGGNCRSDTSIASENGDIYFFSPEQLDGSRGIPNQENLYDYRGGHLEYVATFSGDRHCFESPVPGTSDQACSATPIPRMQVSPNDSHMAFATDSPVTQYDNAGHLEMYLYDPASPSGGMCVLYPQWRAADLRHHGEPGRTVHDLRRPCVLRDRTTHWPTRTRTRARTSTSSWEAGRS